MPTSFRIFKTKHTDAWFDGEGSYLYGGRWNSRGTRLLYTSEALSLAALEMLVHLNSRHLLAYYSFATVGFSESLVLDIKNLVDLPRKWHNSPPPIAVQKIGDEWADSKASLILKVPSSVIPLESNYLINVLHSDFPTLKLGKAMSFSFDERLLGRR